MRAVFAALIVATAFAAAGLLELLAGVRETAIFEMHCEHLQAAAAACSLDTPAGPAGFEAASRAPQMISAADGSGDGNRAGDGPAPKGGRP